MTKWSSNSPIRARILCGVAIALAASLGGCATQVANEDPTDAEYYDAGNDVDVAEAPPPLPDYDQPLCPADGYVWVPGYWAYQSGDLGGGDFYWVPGAWVQPPMDGVLWTPGYWSYAGGGFSFHAGYWGAHVGFYGGINYGYGYPGDGSGISPATTNNASYNGDGGVIAGPTALQREYGEEPHVAATAVQQRHVRQSAKDPMLFVRANGGRPAGTRAAVMPTVLHGMPPNAQQTVVRAQAPQSKPAPEPKPAPPQTSKTTSDFSP